MKGSFLRVGIGFLILAPFFLLSYFDYPLIPAIVGGMIVGTKVWDISNYIVREWIGYRS